MGPRIGQGREAEIFAWGDDAVLKLYRPGFAGHRTETLALATLEGLAVAPRLIDVIEQDGRTGVVLERLGGPDMLVLLQRQPWRVRHFARALAAVHLGIHRRAAPGELGDQREALAARVGEAGLPRALRGFVLGELDRLPVGDRLCHGDFHPANVIVGGDGPRVIDWAAAGRGVPEADHARTMLLLRWANPMPGTPLMLRGMIAALRSLLTREYARAYRQASPQPLRHHSSWLAVNIAARLSEGIDEERPKLLALLNRAHRVA